MPWLSIESSYLWCTQGNILNKYERFKNGRIDSKNPVLSLQAHRDDIFRFNIKSHIALAASFDGSIFIWNKFDGKLLSSKLNGHQSDINSIDCFHEKVVITGSKDTTCRIWTLREKEDASFDLVMKTSIDVDDRVWCVAANEWNNLAVIGSAGYGMVGPLYLYDVERCKFLGQLRENHRLGAGVLHVVCENESTIISCGYDTNIRIWDLRQNGGKCVLKWEDPHDSVVYCMATDLNVTVISGTSRYGLVRLWDKRVYQKCMQMYYVGKENSPVYSLDFDPCHLYVALDRSINLLDFDQNLF